jgi:hypothetical protein
MMQICLEQNYPKNLVAALELLHKIDISTKDVKIHWDKKLTEQDSDSTVVFIFDKGKRTLDFTTEQYFEKGFRVFAFKMATADTLNPFELSLTVLGLWRRVMNIINEEKRPFIYTYSYKGTRMNKKK